MNILIADDDELLIEFLSRALERDKHTVDTASDGIEAIKKALQTTYDIILLDILMPLADGISVCNELRTKNCHTPIIFISSVQDKDTRITGLNDGGDDYITKPFHYDELEARMRAVTRRPQKIRSEKITASNGLLELDSTKKLIQFDNKQLNLRPKEYAVLEYLIRNSGKVVPKDELLQNIWHISITNASNRLEVCAHHIRAKINTKKSVLKTVRGYGYTIER